jgi:type I restriction enzyme M protein
VLSFEKRQASATPWTKELWIYDLRTNMYFTLKTKPLRRSDLDDFVACYNPANRHELSATWSEDNPTGLWPSCAYDEPRSARQV